MQALLQLTKIPWKLSLAEQKQSSQRTTPVLRMHQQLLCKPFARETGNFMLRMERNALSRVCMPCLHKPPTPCVLKASSWPGSARHFCLEMELIEKNVWALQLQLNQFFYCFNIQNSIKYSQKPVIHVKLTPKWVHTLNFYLCKAAPNIPQWLHQIHSLMSLKH